MYSVMYIDDEADLLEIAQMYLEETGIFRVDTSVSPRDAQKRMAAKKYDAVIADYQMPEMDGISFLKYVRATYGNIPFILFTGKGREEIVIEAINNGADYYLQKGGDPDSLFAELIHKLQHAIQFRRDQEIIRINEERLRKSQVIGHTGAWEYNFVTRRIWGSDEAFRIFGILSPAGEIPVEEIEACIPDRARVHQALLDLIREEKAYNLIYTIKPADGSGPKVLRSVAELEKDRNGNATKIVGIVQDITDQTRMESALLESEKKYRTLTENTLVGMGISIGTRIVYANPTLLRMYGYDSLDELKSHTVPDLLTPASREKVIALMQQRERGIPLPERIEEDILRKDGTTRTLAFNVTPIEYEGTVCDQLTFIDVTDQKRAEREQQQSSERFREIYENAPVGIFHSTPNGRLLRANLALARLFGYASVGELLGSVSTSDVGSLFWADTSHRQPFVEKVLSGGAWYSSEEYFRNRDGQLLMVHITCRPLANPGNGETELEGFIEDITERKKAEFSLAERVSGYRDIFDHAVVGIFRTTPHGVFLDVNPTFARIAGYDTPEQMIASVSDIRDQLYVNPRERDRFMESLFRDGIIHNFEAQFYNRDRQVKWMNVNARVVRDETGDVLFYEGTVEDITGRKHIEEALTKSEATFRSLVEQLQDSVVILSLEGEILFANPSAFRLVSMDPDQMRPGITIFQFLDPGTQEQARTGLARIISGISAAPSEFRIRTVPGAARWVESSGIRISYHDGDAILITIRDITDRRESEDELAAMTRKLGLLSKITRHDILNKITVILGYIKVARKKHLDAEGTELLDRLETATKAIREQIEFARIYESLGSHAPQWQSPSVLFGKLTIPPAVTTADGMSGTEVYADPMFERVLYNLVDNSLRHGGSVSVIRLFCEEGPQGLKIVYEDNGPGIAEEEKDLIFERGYGKNTGLGLFLSREILALTGITMKENGIPGRGARFEISVPPGAYRHGTGCPPVPGS